MSQWCRPRRLRGRERGVISTPRQSAKQGQLHSGDHSIAARAVDCESILRPWPGRVSRFEDRIMFQGPRIEVRRDVNSSGSPGFLLQGEFRHHDAALVKRGALLAWELPAQAAGCAKVPVDIEFHGR